MLEKPLIIGTGENFHMAIPLHMFDHLKPMLSSVDLSAETFDSLPDDQKAIVESWYKEIEAILRPVMEEFFVELFDSLHARWTKEEEDGVPSDEGTSDPQQVPEENFGTC